MASISSWCAGLLGRFDEVRYRLPLFWSVHGKSGAVIGDDVVKTKKVGMAQAGERLCLGYEAIPPEIEKILQFEGPQQHIAVRRSCGEIGREIFGYADLFARRRRFS